MYDYSYVETQNKEWVRSHGWGIKDQEYRAANWNVKLNEKSIFRQGWDG